MKRLITAFAATLLFISCENDRGKQALSKFDEAEKEQNKFPEVNTKNIIGDYKKDSVGIPPQVQKPEEPKQPGQVPVAKIDWDKKIIKNASLNLEIKDFKVYNSSLREKVKSVGGYVAQEEQSETEYKIENTLTIKVPVDQFDNALSLLTTGSDKLNEKKITSQDVTTEFVDTRSRMESKKQVRFRYLDLLKQAKNMEEVLSVQSEINGIQEEIESAVGRIEYLGHSSSFSTINLTFYQVLNEGAKAVTEISFSTKVASAFKTGWSWIGELLITIVSIWPLLLLVFTIFVVYKRTKPVKVKQA